MSCGAGPPVIRTLAELGLRVEHAGHVGDVIGAAFGVDGLILHETDLAPDVLDLRTGLLGELFQKLVTYRIPTAVIIPDAAAHGERFTELAREYARHPQVRFVPGEEDAQAWLASVL